jgi:hypothetical protein
MIELREPRQVGRYQEKAQRDLAGINPPSLVWHPKILKIAARVK